MNTLVITIYILTNAASFETVSRWQMPSLTTCEAGLPGVFESRDLLINEAATVHVDEFQTVIEAKLDAYCEKISIIEDHTN